MKRLIVLVILMALAGTPLYADNSYWIIPAKRGLIGYEQDINLSKLQAYNAKYTYRPGAVLVKSSKLRERFMEVVYAGIENQKIKLEVRYRFYPSFSMSEFRIDKGKITTIIIPHPAVTNGKDPYAPPISIRFLQHNLKDHSASFILKILNE